MSSSSFSFIFFVASDVGTIHGQVRLLLFLALRLIFPSMEKIEPHSDIWIGIDSSRMWDIIGHWSFLKIFPPPLGFGSCLTLFWDACELSKRMREKAGIWRRGEENLHCFNQIYKKKTRSASLLQIDVSALFYLWLECHQIWKWTHTSGPILIPKMLGASDFSTVTTLTIFQAKTKGFVVTTMGWVEDWGVVADYKRKVLVIEKKNIF